MARVREDLIWLSVLVLGLGALGAGNLGRGVSHLVKGEAGPGVAVAVILGATATVLALSALVRLLAVLLSALRRRRD